jgi:hypothetical protein
MYIICTYDVHVYIHTYIYIGFLKTNGGVTPHSWMVYFMEKRTARNERFPGLAPRDRGLLSGGVAPVHQLLTMLVLVIAWTWDLGDLSCNKPTMVILWIYSGKISTR